MKAGPASSPVVSGSPTSWVRTSPAPEPATTARPARARRSCRSCTPAAPALDPLRVGDQHLPAVPDRLIVHEPRPVHRLHHAPDRLVADGHAAREPVQAVAVRRCRTDRLTPVGDQADIDALATQVKPNVQHALLPAPRAGAGRIRRSHRVPSTGWSVLSVQRPARAACRRARPTHAVRHRGPTPPSGGGCTASASPPPITVPCRHGSA
jgi:hypothetical protein